MARDFNSVCMSDVNSEEYVASSFQRAISPEPGFSDLVIFLVSLIGAGYASYHICDLKGNCVGKFKLFCFHGDTVEVLNLPTIDPFKTGAVKREVIDAGFIPFSYLIDGHFLSSELRYQTNVVETIEYGLVAVFRLDKHSSLIISLYRDREEGNFGSKDRSVLNDQFEFIESSVRYYGIYRNQYIKSIGRRSLIDQIRRPLWLVDEKLRVLYRNSEAGDKEKSDKICHPSVTGMVGFNVISAVESERLKNIIHSVSTLSCAEHSGSYHSFVTSSGQVECFFISPVPDISFQSGGGGNAVLICGAVTVPSSATIREVLGLSRRQAELCECIATGYSLQEAASHMGITYNTVRNTLISCYRKLDVSSQSQLVIKVFSCFG